MSSENSIKWTPEMMVEIKFDNEDDFLKIKETLSRIGIASFKTKTLWQSCHILHKKGKYYIVHFKEMFALDGRSTTISEEDVSRRNRIINMLSEWGLIDIVDTDKVTKSALDVDVRVIKYSDKQNWNLMTKYNIGGGVK